MPVFTKKLSKIGISYIDGTMTIYPAAVQDRVTSTQVAIANAAFSGGPTLAEQNSSLIRNISRSLHFIGHIFDKFSRCDGDKGYALFHRDERLMDDWYYHVKFKSGLDHLGMDDVLHSFVAFGVISLAEKNSVLRDFYFRYVNFRASLDSHLSGVKSSDLPRIISEIVDCEDNDLLIDLHKYLLTEKFDYLRVKTGISSFSFWRGTNRSGSVVSTSKSWATIEKGIMLKIVENIKDQSAHFDGARP